MCRKISFSGPFPVVAALAITLGLTPPDQRYEEAWEHFSAGRIVEARELLEALLEDHPDYWTDGATTAFGSTPPHFSGRLLNDANSGACSNV